MSWPSFAFDEQSAWGLCYQAFIRRAYDRSGSKSTLHHYTHALRTFFSTSPTKSPENYTRQDVENYLHSGGLAPGRVGRAPSAGTINNRLSIISNFYRYAAEYGIEDETGMLVSLMRRMSPAAGLKQLQRDKPPYRALNSEELHKFFSAIDTSTIIGTRDYALFLCYFILARRRAELRRLTWGDIRQETIVEAGIRREGYVYTFTSKGHSRQSDRAEMPAVCYQAIVKYLEISGKLPTIQASDPIFTATPDSRGRYAYDPHRPLSAQAIYSACKRIAHRAGLDANRVTVHSFRHSASRERYAAGSDIREIQRLLRHSSLQTTDTYLSQLTSTGDSGYRLIQAKFEDL
jgi:integrase